MKKSYKIEANMLADNVMDVELYIERTGIVLSIGVFHKIKDDRWVTLSDWRVVNIFEDMLDTTNQRFLRELAKRKTIEFELKAVRTDII